MSIQFFIILSQIHFQRVFIVIGRLRGTLLEKQPPEVLIEVNGIGYEVQMPMSCFYELPNVGEEALFILTLLCVKTRNCFTVSTQ